MSQSDLRSVIQAKQNEISYLESLCETLAPAVQNVKLGDKERKNLSPVDLFQAKNYGQNYVGTGNRDNGNMGQNKFGFGTEEVHFGKLRKHMQTLFSIKDEECANYESLMVALSYALENLKGGKNNKEEEISKLKQEIEFQNREISKLSRKSGEVVRERDEMLTLCEQFGQQLRDVREATETHRAQFKKQKKLFQETIVSLKVENASLLKAKKFSEESELKIKNEYASFQEKKNQEYASIMLELEKLKTSLTSSNDDLKVAKQTIIALESNKSDLENRIEESKKMWKSHLTEVEGIKIEKLKLEKVIQDLLIKNDHLTKALTTVRVSAEVDSFSSRQSPLRKPKIASPTPFYTPKDANFSASSVSVPKLPLSFGISELIPETSMEDMLRKSQLEEDKTKFKDNTKSAAGKILRKKTRSCQTVATPTHNAKTSPIPFDDNDCGESDQFSKSLQQSHFSNPSRDNYNGIYSDKPAPFRFNNDKSDFVDTALHADHLNDSHSLFYSVQQNISPPVVTKLNHSITKKSNKATFKDAIASSKWPDNSDDELEAEYLHYLA